jgi:glutamate formiminotransferase
VDVVPVVPLRPEDEPRAREVALRVADRVAEELRLPVYFYGSLTEDRREPAYFRRGNLDWLTQDRGPALHPSAGAVLVGVRPPLIALNVNLASQDLEAARQIASVVRERGGGFRGVRALGFELPRAGMVQVSMNITDWPAAPPHEVVARIRAEAGALGIEVAGTELVGLLPAGAAVGAAAEPLGIEGLDASRILELRLLDGS